MAATRRSETCTCAPRTARSCAASIWSCADGELHALMGPNGSGKSTLANTIMGHPSYEVTDGEILLDGEDITELAPHERAKLGLFLAFQYPVAIPGVSVANFLRLAINAQREEPIKVKEFGQRAATTPSSCSTSTSGFTSRHLNDGFSGGEKKRAEILQMAMLQPQIAVLDETDSGLDIDALRTVAEGVAEAARRAGPRRADHHPLPAHPRLRQAAVRPHHDGRADRDGRRQRARRAPRARGLRPRSAKRSPRRCLTARRTRRAGATRRPAAQAGRRPRRR